MYFQQGYYVLRFVTTGALQHISFMPFNIGNGYVHFLHEQLFDSKCAQHPGFHVCRECKTLLHNATHFLLQVKGPEGLRKHQYHLDQIEQQLSMLREKEETLVSSRQP